MCNVLGELSAQFHIFYNVVFNNVGFNLYSFYKYNHPWRDGGEFCKYKTLYSYIQKNVFLMCALNIYVYANVCMPICYTWMHM